MGKKGGRSKRFIDPKKDVLATFSFARCVPEAFGGEATAYTDAPVKKKKFTCFQLRCDMEAEQEELPALPEDKPATRIAQQIYSEVKEQPTIEQQIALDSSQSLVNEQQEQQEQELQEQEEEEHDPNDFSRYGVYYYDGYDYGQHLMDPTSSAWNDPTVEFSTTAKQHPQQNKKDRKLQFQTKPNYDRQIYIPPPRDPSITVITEGIESDSFDDADAEELPDNIMDFLDADEPIEDFKPNESLNSARSGNDNFFEQNDGNAEVDYSQMPPLEQFDDEISGSGFEFDDDEDCISNVSNDCMDVSNVSISDDEDAPATDNNQLANSKCINLIQNCNADFPSNSVPKKNSDKICKPDDGLSETAKLNWFFDGVDKDFNADEPEKEDEQPRWGAAPPPVMDSSKGVKEATSALELANEHFNNMVLRDYKDDDIGDEKLDEVEGFLADDAPQFLQALKHDMETRNGNERVSLLGSGMGKETKEEAETRRQAIQFTKSWKLVRDEPVELSIPDPKAMKYNVSNLPCVRNKNMPGIIKPDLPNSNKKKKGLTMRDLRQHDLEMNTPHRDEEDERQTYKTALTEFSYRPPNETSQERLERKSFLKELRKGRRVEKKANTLAQKDDLRKTTKTKTNAKHCRVHSMI